jgi:HEAT repeat protein
MTLDESFAPEPSPLAAEAMTAVQAIGPEAIQHLLHWIQPPWPNSILPSGAVRSFKVLGRRAEVAIPELIRLFEVYKPSGSFLDDQFSAWTHITEALSYLGPEALAFLLAAAKNSDCLEATREIIHYLGNFGSEGVPAIADLIGWTRHRDQWIRLNAVNALGRIAQDPERVIPALLECLNDADMLVRRDAAVALGRFRNAARECAPKLISQIDEPDWHAQTGAILALARVGEREDVVLPLLARKLHDGNRIIRRCAALALGELGSPRAFDVLMEAVADPDDSAREAVFQSLKKIDPVGLEKSGKKFSDGCRWLDGADF